MYETHYQLKSKPFTLLPDPEFLYLGNHHKTALSLLEYGMASKVSFIVMTGEPGTGKTTLLNRLLSQAGHLWTIGVVSNIHSGLSELMPWVAAAFGLQTKDKSQVDLFQEFSQFLEDEQIAGRSVLLALDEAHNIGATMLEELRLLSNLNDGRCRSLQILLSGQPGLLKLLVGPEMVQLAQRVGVEYKLDSLSEEEIESYISHRLQVAGRETSLFSPLASRIVYRLAGGVPRLVNQLCDHALIYGYAEQAEWITAHIVLNAAATRARLGVLPLAISPEDVTLSQAELRMETGNLATFGKKDLQPQPISRDQTGRDPILTELRAETGDRATFEKKAQEPQLIPREQTSGDLIQAELRAEVVDLPTFGKKDLQPQLVSREQTGSDLIQAEQRTEPGDLAIFGRKDPQVHSVQRERASDDPLRAELSTEVGNVSIVEKKDLQPQFVSREQTNRGLIQAELRTEAEDRATFRKQDQEPPPVASEQSRNDLAQDLASVYRKGLALKEGGEYRKALRYFDKLTEDDRWAVKALAQKGLCLKAIGRHDDALTVIQEAASQGSATADDRNAVQYLLARTFEARGRYREAREVYLALDLNQQGYRDVSVRLAQLDSSQADEPFTIDIPVSKFSAFWRGCGQLFRGLQG